MLIAFRKRFNNPESYALSIGIMLYLIILCVLFASLGYHDIIPVASASSEDGIRMRRFYDTEAGVICYTAYDTKAGLSTSCVKVAECQLQENPKFFALK